MDVRIWKDPRPLHLVRSSTATQSWQIVHYVLILLVGGTDLRG